VTLRYRGRENSRPPCRSPSTVSNMVIVNDIIRHEPMFSKIAEAEGPLGERIPLATRHQVSRCLSSTHQGIHRRFGFEQELSRRGPNIAFRGRSHRCSGTGRTSAQDRWSSPSLPTTKKIRHKWSVRDVGKIEPSALACLGHGRKPSGQCMKARLDWMRERPSIFPSLGK
jgi:hypothetical protein